MNSQILALLFDAQASELSSRMTAMKVATDNSKDLQKKLLLLYNKKLVFEGALSCLEGSGWNSVGLWSHRTLLIYSRTLRQVRGL